VWRTAALYLSMCWRPAINSYFVVFDYFYFRCIVPTLSANKRSLAPNPSFIEHVRICVTSTKSTLEKMLQPCSLLERSCMFGRGYLSGVWTSLAAYCTYRAARTSSAVPLVCTLYLCTVYRL
jgi:hypothetical protein